MNKLQRSIICLLVITVFAYILKFGFSRRYKRFRRESFMTYDSATTPNAIAKRFEPFESFEVTNIGNSRCSGGVCPTNSTAHKMCLEMAGDNCRIPTYPDNGCWMSVFNECKNQCSRDVKTDCNCTSIANAKCQTGGDPAEACLGSVYQKCMSGQVAGIPDPDRG